MNFSVEISGNIVYLRPDSYLGTNKQYTVTISPGISGYYPPSGELGIISDTYTFWFTSIYCPQFSTPSRIRLQAGPAIDDVIDDTIYKMIHRNSMDAIDLYNLYNGTNVAYDYWGCDWIDIPIHMKRYVECKTAYDLLSIMKMAFGFTGGPNQSKTLGDMNISYTGSSNMAPDPKKLSELYTCWQESLRMFKIVKATVKGYYDSSKQFLHPTRSNIDNRVLRPVIPYQNNFTPGTFGYRGF